MNTSEPIRDEIVVIEVDQAVFRVARVALNQKHRIAGHTPHWLSGHMPWNLAEMVAQREGQRLGLPVAGPVAA